MIWKHVPDDRHQERANIRVTRKKAENEVEAILRRNERKLLEVKVKVKVMTKISFTKPNTRNQKIE